MNRLLWVRLQHEALPIQSEPGSLPVVTPLNSTLSAPSKRMPHSHIVAEIFSWSTVHPLLDLLLCSPTPCETLPPFYSEPQQAGVHPHHETDRWQLHRHGSREGPGTVWKPIWQQGRAGMRDCEGFGTCPNLRNCSVNRPRTERQDKRVWSRGNKWHVGRLMCGVSMLSPQECNAGMHIWFCASGHMGACFVHLHLLYTPEPICCLINFIATS